MHKYCRSASELRKQFADRAGKINFLLHFKFIDYIVNKLKKCKKIFYGRISAAGR